MGFSEAPSGGILDRMGGQIHVREIRLQVGW